MYLWAASYLHVSHYIVFCATLKPESLFSLVSLTFILAKRNGTNIAVLRQDWGLSIKYVSTF